MSAKRATSFAHTFNVQLYGWRVFLFVERDKYARFASRRTGTPIAERRAEAADSDGLTLCRKEAHELVIAIFDGEPGTLAHEATHAAFYILTGAGVKLTSDNDEPLAYLVGYIVDECIPSIVKTWKTRK